jgi:hypothetical protein
MMSSSKMWVPFYQFAEISDDIQHTVHTAVLPAMTTANSQGDLAESLIHLASCLNLSSHSDQFKSVRRLSLISILEGSATALKQHG